MSSLIAELRRRNVLRVAATYAVVAWIIIEAGSVLLPTFGASESAFQIYVVVVVVWLSRVAGIGLGIRGHARRGQAREKRRSFRVDYTRDRP